MFKVSFLKSKKVSSNNLETQESVEFIESITNQNSGFVVSKNQSETFDQSGKRFVRVEYLLKLVFKIPY
jgi:hypothetical protein